VTITWEEALADCEARLDAAVAALEAGRPVVTDDFETPDVDQTLPAGLVDRARTVARLSEELESRLADELERIRLELRRLPRLPRAQRESRFDVQA
jgi:hypothetical protein